MVVAVDIGGTFIKLGLVENAKVIVKTAMKSQTKEKFQKTMMDIEQAINNLLMTYSFSQNDIEGIGIGFPGLVDSDTMKVLSSNKKYDEAIDFDFIKWGRDAFNAPTFLENDTRIALLGEWQFGAGKGIDNIVMLSFGTGIGSATLLEGKLLKGKHFQAGNLGGHFTIKVNGALCTCGNLGCGEAEASTWKLPYLLRSDSRYYDSMIKDKELDFESLFEYARRGCELSMSVRDRCLEIWAALIINQIHAYDPELIILGGGVMESADVIIPFVKKIVNKRAWTPWGKVEIIQSKLPNKSALLGAYYLVNNKIEEHKI